MKYVTLVISLFILSVNVSLAQNYNLATISAGAHFAGSTQEVDYDPGFLASVSLEPKISSFGNIDLGIDMGIFRSKDGNRNGNKFSFLGGYKQKFFNGKTSYFISGQLGIVYKGFGYKLALGAEYKFSKNNLLIFEAFRSGSITTITGDGGRDGVGSLFGATVGFGFIY
ncbi:MAG: hypothetical protein ABIY50_07860 [Ignavibacteria bacterium]